MAQFAERLQKAGVQAIVYTNGESLVRAQRRWIYERSQWPIKSAERASIREINHTSWAIYDARHPPRAIRPGVSIRDRRGELPHSSASAWCCHASSLPVFSSAVLARLESWNNKAADSVCKWPFSVLLFVLVHFFKQLHAPNILLWLGALSTELLTRKAGGPQV